jgi:hypothetical protein
MTCAQSDFAWMRGQRYGTVLCDLERRHIVDLLPNREAGTVEGWLARSVFGAQPSCNKITGNREEVSLQSTFDKLSSYQFRINPILPVAAISSKSPDLI